MPLIQLFDAFYVETNANPGSTPGGIVVVPGPITITHAKSSATASASIDPGLLAITILGAMSSTLIVSMPAQVGGRQQAVTRSRAVSSSGAIHRGRYNK